RWMDERGIPAGILVGNSLGGQVIIDFAARYPDRLTGAVLVGPTIDPDARRSLTQIWRLAVDIFREPGRLIAIGVIDYLRAGFHWCLRTLHHALQHPVLEMLPQIQVPVLIVRGGRDPITSEAWADRATALIPRAWHVTIPHAAHAVNFNAPEDLVREILDFLRKQSLLD
ncbi:MAG: alpha/beta hydrolase, partial [Verrucomicrobiaceae bacterium]